MKPTSLRPTAQIFVCTNARAPDDPLTSGCGAAGPEVFRTLKTLALGAVGGGRVWVTATGCLGHCPRTGCSAVIHPHNLHYVQVTPRDAPALLEVAMTPPRPPTFP